MIKNKLLTNGLCALTVLSIFGSPIVHAEDETNNTTQVWSEPPKFVQL